MCDIPDCTLTTACYLLDKYHPHARSLSDTIKGMETLLSVPCYLVIYCNKTLEEYIQNTRNKYNLGNLTKIIVQEIEDIWAYQFADKIKKNREVYWPTRDSRISVESTAIVFNKFNFVLQTIKSNPFNTTKFGWIDGSLGPNGSKICESNFNNLLLYNLKNITNKFHLQILNVEDKKYKNMELKAEFYQQARWVACGCLFTTSTEIGIKILTRLQEIVAKTIEDGYGHGEEYFYLEVLDEFYDDIYRGYGDYGQILHNFLKPHKNLVYVYWNIVMRYLNFGYHKECIDVCKSILNTFDNFEIEINYDMYVRLYGALYMSLYAIQSNETEIVANKIKNYYNTNPYFKSNFNNLKGIIGLINFII